MAVASKPGLAMGGTPTLGPEVICKKHSWLERKHFKHEMTTSKEEFTYIFRGEVVEMSLDRGEVLHVHICTTGDEAIVQGPLLQRK